MGPAPPPRNRRAPRQVVDPYANFPRFGTAGQAEPSNGGPLVRLARWVRSGRLAPLGPFARDVLLAIAAHEGIERGAFVSDATIARLMGRTAKRIFRLRKRLEEAGVIERLGQSSTKHGAPGAIRYRIRGCSPSTGGTTREGGGATSLPGGGATPRRWG